MLVELEFSEKYKTFCLIPTSKCYYEDGEEIDLIELKRNLIIKDDLCMDLPQQYHNISTFDIQRIMNNNGRCSLEVDSKRRVKKFGDKMVIVI